MPYANNSITSYPDVAALFDQALASAKGVKVTFSSHAEAVFQSGRFNAYRVRHRRQNRGIYPADHPLHNASIYDGIMVRVKDCTVELHRLSIDQFNVEQL